jgi:hypothetical protein
MAICGGCGFATAMSGSWSVEDGRLTWRADPDPQPRRGPDLNWCGESDRCPPDGFKRVTVDNRELSAEDIGTLRATAGYARIHEFDAS